MRPVCSSSVVGEPYPYHSIFAVITFAAIGYDYGKLYVHVPIRCTNFDLTSPHNFKGGTRIVPSLYTMFFSLIIYVDRIHLGQQIPGICRGDTFLITPQNQPWSWVSTLYIVVCIGLASALSRQVDCC